MGIFLNQVISITKERLDNSKHSYPKIASAKRILRTFT